MNFELVNVDWDAAAKLKVQAINLKLEKCYQGIDGSFFY